VKVSIIEGDQLIPTLEKRDIKCAVFTDCFEQGYSNQVLIDINE
jgi:hypothetical protein